MADGWREDSSITDFQTSPANSQANCVTSTPKVKDSTNIRTFTAQFGGEQRQANVQILQSLSSAFHLLQTQNHPYYRDTIDEHSLQNIQDSFGLGQQMPESGNSGHQSSQQQQQNDLNYLEVENTARDSTGLGAERSPLPTGRHSSGAHNIYGRFIDHQKGNGFSMNDGVGTKVLKAEKKEPKEKKSITTKTFAKGMMDVSLLTSNATQLRAVLSNPHHEFYTLLIWLISLSVALQVTSSVLLIMSDFFKTQVKETDRQNQRKRKTLNFVSLALITIVTSLNVLISAFYSPGTSYVEKQQTVPQFSQAAFTTSHHNEL